MKKMTKRITIALVLVLAVIGAYSLLKRAPQIDLPNEDRGYLEEVYGSKMTGSGRASQSGTSALLENSVTGAPEIGSDLSSGSNTPPSSWSTASTAPPYGAMASEAPAFSASSDAPPYAPIPSYTPIAEAPAFQLPAANPAPPAAGDQVAPAYGSEYQAVPVLSPGANAVPIGNPGSPVPAPQTSPPFPAETGEGPPITQSSPPFWDGPTTQVFAAPSSVLVEPRGASDVNEKDLHRDSMPVAEQFVSSVVSPVDLTTRPQADTSSEWPKVAAMTPNVTSSAIPSEPRSDVFVAPTSDQTFSSPNVSSLNEAHFPAEGVLEKIAVDPSAPLSASVPEKTVFVKPKLKRLPQVDEPLRADLTVAHAVPDVPQAADPLPPSPPVDAVAANPIVSNHTLPEDYRQTSARNTMVLAPVKRNSEDEIPKISLSLPVQPAGQAENAVHGAETDAPTFQTETFAMEKAVETIPFAPETASEIADPGESVAPAASPASSDRTEKEIRQTVTRFVEAQCQQVETGDPEKMRNAFIQLSRLYDHPELSDGEKAYLTPTLDRLALDIIFSCKTHILEPTYVVQSGDTVDSIASKYHLSPALLMKINGLTGARPLKPETELKVVLGQFDAKVSMKRGEMVLILGGLYAGRFPVSVGEEIAQVRGEFVVTSKSDSFKGKTMTLSNGIQLLGCGRIPSGGSGDGALRFSDRDANELFDILTERSVMVLED